MNANTTAEEALHRGDPVGALKLLEQEVRAHASDAKLRIFLFQLLSVLGQWERALNQLDVAAKLDPSALAMAQMYGGALKCEMLRGEVFAGRKSPMVFGQPEQWLALLIEAVLMSGAGKLAQAQTLRSQAFDEAPESPGTIGEGKPFAWIADADMRFGPVLEAIINGRYYWIPFARLTRIVIDEPQDLRDLVWMPVHLGFENGGESVALIPTRYPGSEVCEDGELALARKTIWSEPAPEFFCGLGQRVLATDLGETALTEIREVTLNPTPTAEAGPPHD